MECISKTKGKKAARFKTVANSWAVCALFRAAWLGAIISG